VPKRHWSHLPLNKIDMIEQIENRSLNSKKGAASSLAEGPPRISLLSFFYQEIPIFFMLLYPFLERMLLLLLLVLFSG
jgi:hypothetical protein